MDQRVYQVGVTLLVVGSGISNITMFKAAPYQVGSFLKLSAGSSVSLVQHQGQSHTLGYPMATTDQPIQLNGPAQFLISAGATATIAQLILFGPGYSLQP